MVDFADLVQLPTRQAIKASIISYAQNAGLRVTSWILGEPSERWIEISARVIDGFLSNVTTQAIRAFFLERNTDPGDAGDLSPDQTPRPGWLSALGSGWYGVQRGGATYAEGFVTVTNTGTTPATFSAFDLTIQRSTAGAGNSGYPTYRNTEDAAIYTGAGATLTLSVGASATIPIVCEQAGTFGNASPGEASVLVTQSFGTLTVTNASPVLGSDREDRLVYIARCREQSAAASPGGPADAFRYAAVSASNGDPLQLWDGSGATTVNRVFVSADASDGTVTIYLANPSGPATAVEVSSANGNINGIPIEASNGKVYNVNPIGVVPDTVVLGPITDDPKTHAPGPDAATATLIAPIAGTVRIKAVAGTPTTELVAAVQKAIAAALSEFFSSPETAPIGGVDQVAGAGVIYMSDVATTIRDAYPVGVGVPVPPPLYGVRITKPSSATQVIAHGHVPTYAAASITAVANNGGGLCRLTVSQDMTGIATVQIYNTVGTQILDGTWTATYIDGTHIDLVASVYTGGWVSSSLSLIVLTVVA